MYQKFNLKIQRLVCIQGEKPLFKPVDFDVSNGQVVLLHGPNGVGKTTCLRTLAGLLSPAHGSITWNEEKTIYFNPDYFKQIAYLGHQIGIKHALTPAENLKWYLNLINQAQYIRYIPDVLNQLKINVEINSGLLSAGQQRRIALARLYLADFPLWILDEPLNALDAEAVALFQHLLYHHQKKQGAVILTSHQYFAYATHTVEIIPW